MITSTEISIVVNQYNTTKKKTQTRRTRSHSSSFPASGKQIRDALEIQYSSRGANLEARFSVDRRFPEVYHDLTPLPGVFSPICRLLLKPSPSGGPLVRNRTARKTYREAG